MSPRTSAANFVTTMAAKRAKHHMPPLMARLVEVMNAYAAAGEQAARQTGVAAVLSWQGRVHSCVVLSAGLCAGHPCHTSDGWLADLCVFASVLRVQSKQPTAGVSLSR